MPTPLTTDLAELKRLHEERDGLAKRVAKIERETLERAAKVADAYYKQFDTEYPFAEACGHLLAATRIGDAIRSLIPPATT